MESPRFSEPNTRATLPDDEPPRISLRAFFEAPERVLRFAMVARGGSDYQNAIGDSFRHAAILFGPREKGRGAPTAERASRNAASCGFTTRKLGNPRLPMARAAAPMLRRIARGREHHAQAAGFNGSEQACILRHAGPAARAAELPCRAEDRDGGTRSRLCLLRSEAALRVSSLDLVALDPVALNLALTSWWRSSNRSVREAAHA